MELTKETDSYYLQKRSIAKEYNPAEPYNFDSWQDKFNKDIKNRYETLHLDLLYTSEKQDFNQAIYVFKSLNEIFSAINE